MHLGLALLPILVTVGSGLDLARASTAKVRLQDALDASALAAIQQPSAGRVAFAQQFLRAYLGQASNSFSSLTYNFTLNADGSLSGTANGTIATSLMSVAGIRTMSVSATTEAAPATTTNSSTSGSSSGSSASSSACILLLDPSNSQTLLLNSGAKISAPNCRVDVATTGSPAAIFNSNTTLTASKICLKGSTYINNGGTVSTVSTGCTTLSDPYAGKLPAPTSTTCTGSTANSGNYNGGSVTLSPGVYCGWFNFNSAPNVTLQPGLYVIKGGGWNVNGGTWTGNGVTFYFADTSKIQFNSGMNMNLAAPTSGTYKGLLFYEASGLTPSQFVFNDSVSETLTGLIYLPSRQLTFNSTSNLTSPSLSVVAYSAIFNTVNWNLAPASTTSAASTYALGR